MENGTGRGGAQHKSIVTVQCKFQTHFISEKENSLNANTFNITQPSIVHIQMQFTQFEDLIPVGMQPLLIFYHINCQMNLDQFHVLYPDWRRQRTSNGRQTLYFNSSIW